MMHMYYDFSILLQLKDTIKSCVLFGNGSDFATYEGHLYYISNTDSKLIMQQFLFSLFVRGEQDPPCSKE